MNVTNPTSIPDYGMYSPDGNEAVHALMADLQQKFWEGIKHIKEKHSEVVYPPATQKIWAALKNFYHANPDEITPLKKESKIGDYVHHKEEIKGIVHDISEDRKQATIKLPDGSCKTVEI